MAVLQGQEPKKIRQISPERTLYLVQWKKNETKFYTLDSNHALVAHACNPSY
jgi:hypothetical protein